MRESRTSGSEGGPEKPTDRKVDRALWPDPYCGAGRPQAGLDFIANAVTRLAGEHLPPSRGAIDQTSRSQPPSAERQLRDSTQCTIRFCSCDSPEQSGQLVSIVAMSSSGFTDQMSPGWARDRAVDRDDVDLNRISERVSQPEPLGTSLRASPKAAGQDLDGHRPTAPEEHHARSGGVSATLDRRRGADGDLARRLDR